ncbi:hypothetical protein BU17DRAFT_99274 [Hysterangium stoloniferum]|nr:hypothetical protein BU17DRAFT_99274 [Hysterangium stoloniferum]
MAELKWQQEEEECVLMQELNEVEEAETCELEQMKAEKEVEEKRKEWLWKVMEDQRLREEAEKKWQDAMVQWLKEKRDGKIPSDTGSPFWAGSLCPN